MTTSNSEQTAPAIEIRGATKRFRTPKGGVFTALRDFDLTIAPGEFCAVVGPTGCGKSTTLTLVSGLERASEGTVEVDGAPVSGITPGVGFMFQQDAVFPWKKPPTPCTWPASVVATPRLGIGERGRVAVPRRSCVGWRLPSPTV